MKSIILLSDFRFYVYCSVPHDQFSNHECSCWHEATWNFYLYEILYANCMQQVRYLYNATSA